MGFYIETPGHKRGKVRVLRNEHDATLIKVTDPSWGIKLVDWSLFDKIIDDPNQVLIAVVENRDYDAAMIVYDSHELGRIRRSIDEGDPRKICWLSMDPLVVKRLNASVPMID